MRPNTQPAQQGTANIIKCHKMQQGNSIELPRQLPETWCNLQTKETYNY